MHQRFPPGWYLNPNGPGQRYWDGDGWTGQYETIPVSPAAARPRRRRAVLAIALGAVVVVAVVAWVLVA